ncbi:MAG TPA: hypothetical protein VF522_01310 [Ramlibacter sp.]|uniref:hypothetical protein n=1 Tax=Ramlibacter sp. TaxID=1917967 RepID=UPI002ED2144D
MSAFQSQALDAIAFQLVASLEKYERDVATMVDTWLDMDLYCRVSEQVEEIRMYSAALPQLSVQWVELLIAHAELLHSLWRLRFREVEADRGRLAELHERHGDCVVTLRARALRLLACSERRRA